MSEIKIVRKNKLKPVLLTLVIFIALSMAAGTTWWSNQFEPIDRNDHKEIEIMIPANSNANQIAVLLKQNGLIHNEFAFQLYCRQQGLDAKLKAGTLFLKPSQSLAEIAESIAQGLVINNKITIPEGFTNKQIGELLIKYEICTSEQWDGALQQSYDFPFLVQIPATQPNRLEGFLFPDTYFIDRHTTAPKMVQMMLEGFQKVWSGDLEQQAQTQNISVYDTVIIGSLIEREARIDAERSKISGVIYNRLERGMMLQLCASVLYALPVYKEELSYDDLEIDSPYNTYKHYGLPPGPVANPGRASLEAALNPEQHDYLFYVAKGDGSHQFSTNYNDHLAATRKVSD